MTHVAPKIRFMSSRYVNLWPVIFNIFLEVASRKIPVTINNSRAFAEMAAQCCVGLCHFVLLNNTIAYDQSISQSLLIKKHSS